MAELKTAYGGQTPRADDSDTDELIQRAYQVIESVYDEHGITSTPSTTVRPSDAIRDSPLSSRQLEIQRIIRFCDTIDDEVTYTLSHPEGSSSLGSRSINERVRAAPEDHILRGNSGSPNTDINLAAEDLAGHSNVILADSAIRIPFENTSTYSGSPSRNSEGEDDVIIVSSNLPDVVDLCTPEHDTSNRRRSNRQYTLSNRQNINQATSARRNGRWSTSAVNRSAQPVVTCHCVARTSVQHPSQQRGLSEATPRTGAADKSGNASIYTANQSSMDTNSNSGTDNPILMCPVCMESSVKRNPTSTKCGHVFCQICINQALRLTHKCPMCKTKLTERMLFRIYP